MLSHPKMFESAHPKMFESALPEILANFNNSNRNVFDLKFNEIPDNEAFFFQHDSYKNSQKKDLIGYLYQNLPVEPIIKYLNKMRIDLNEKLYRNFNEALSNLIQTNRFFNFVLNEPTNYSLVDKNTVDIELLLTGDTLDAIYYPNLDKIKKIELRSTNLIFTETKFKRKTFELQPNVLQNYNDTFNSDSTSDKDLINMNTILFSNYSFPLTVLYQKLVLKIQFDDENFDPKKIKFVNGILSPEIRQLLNLITFELNVQEGNYLVFSQGLLSEHFYEGYEIFHNNTLNPTLQKIFDEAEQEAERRKNF